VLYCYNMYITVYNICVIFLYKIYYFIYVKYIGKGTEDIYIYI